MKTVHKKVTSAEGWKKLLFGRLFDLVDHGLAILDDTRTILVANRWLEEEFASKMPLAGKDLKSVLFDDPSSSAELDRLRSLSTAAHVDIVRRGPQQAERWLQVAVRPVRDPDAVGVGALLHVHDITERKQAEQILTDQISRWRTMVEQSRDGIVMLDRNGKVQEANQAFARMIGYSLEEVYQLHVWDWEAVLPKEEVLDMIDKVDSTGDHFETTHRRKDGSTYEVEISSNGAIVNGEKLVFCVCRDVTEKKAMQERIRQLAIRDPLTEIYNRRHIFERSAEIVAEYARGGTSFCVSILDLDHFKSINDKHGHLAGDFVLKEFAQTVSSAIRPYDLLGRHGGEEFIIVSKNAGWRETIAMIERVMALVRGRGLWFGHWPLQMTFSCGVADSCEFSRDLCSIEEMVKLADERLYTAKTAGRDLCVGPYECEKVRAGSAILGPRRR